MYKSLPPSTESGIDVPENFIIPDLPNIPPGCEDNLSKERLCKISSGHSGHSQHVITLRPVNLEEIPHSVSKHTLEKEMISGFQGMGSTKNTVWPIINVPMSSSDHVLSVDPVHNEQPGKSLDF